MSKSSRKVISLFSGAGGIDHGLEAAGFATAVALELDADAAATLRHNRDWPVLERNIHDVPSAELLAVAEAQPGEVALVAGGPPCQPFSKSGYWARGDSKRLDDPRASTLEAFLRVVRDVQPEAFLFENVRGIKYANKDEGFHLLRRTIDYINRRCGTRYRPAHAVIDSAWFGVPQERERFFLIAHREGREFTFPMATHGPPCQGADSRQLSLEDGSPRLEPWATAWDATGDLVDDDDPSLRVKGKWADLLPTIPEGTNYLHHTERGAGRPLFGWRRRFWSFLRKLAKDRPSWTITAQPGPAIGPFHWKSRRLSMRELSRLQTFPDDVSIVGSQASILKQAGNAVPSALAELLGRAIRRQLLGEPRVSPRPTLCPAVRRPIPPPEPPARLPRKFLLLEGAHDPHPGTGMDYGALARIASS